MEDFHADRPSSPPPDSYPDSIQMDTIKEGPDDHEKARKPELTSASPTSSAENGSENVPNFFRQYDLPSDSARPPHPKISLLRLIVLITLFSAGALLAIFIINGFVMIFGFYNLYVSMLNTMDIASVSVRGLDGMDATIAQVASFKPGFLAKFVHFKVKSPSKLEVIVPDMIIGHQRNPTLVSIDVPSFSFDRGQEDVNLEMTMKINEKIPVNDLVKWYMDRDAMGRFLKIRGNVRVFTWAFLFPLSYTYEYEKIVPLAGNSKKSKAEPMITVDSLEFYEQKGKKTLKAEVGLKISSKIFPRYLSMEVPSFQFGVNHYIDHDYPSEFIQVFVFQSYRLI